MPVTKSYHDYVIDQMRKVPAVSSRAMFGGYAVYSKDVAFAILDDDRLYFKTDEANRTDYESAGMTPWDPYGDGRVSFSNFELPESVLEDPGELARWAAKSIEVALRKKKKPAKPKKAAVPARKTAQKESLKTKSEKGSKDAGRRTRK